MIIGSLNIIGGGNALKRRRISALIRKSNAKVFMIQETKISNLHDFVAKKFLEQSRHRVFVFQTLPVGRGVS